MTVIRNRTTVKHAWARDVRSSVPGEFFFELSGHKSGRIHATITNVECYMTAQSLATLVEKARTVFDQQIGELQFHRNRLGR